MAVVFISPKQRQKTFFIVITAVFSVFLLVIFLGVFLSGPKEISSELVFNKPKVSIDMSIFESDQFKNLQPFIEMGIQYSYTAVTKDRKTVTGFVIATSIDEAETILKNKDLTVSELKIAQIGRSNPFVPYYTKK